MKLLDEYFEIQEKIYDYFGYKEDWRVLPLDDKRDYLWYDYLWYISDDEVLFAKTLKDFEKSNGEYYSDELYGNIIHVTEDYTMIAVDTHTDGNKFLAIYDNNKKLKENPINEEYGGLYV